MTLEKRINEFLQRYPKAKKILKRIYQKANVLIFTSSKCRGEIIKVSPDDKNHDYFFGYYDKSPIDITNRFVLCLRASDTSKNPAPDESAAIILIDIRDNKNYVIGTTRAWNVQQGCMLQWFGPNFKEKIIYNDFRQGKLCSVILDIHTKKEEIFEVPVYSVSSNGEFGLTLDFLRLNTFRPGYGYSNLIDKTKSKKIPNEPSIYKITFASHAVIPLLTYEKIINFDYKESMKDAYHKVNHIMISPNNQRFMFIHRWINGTRKYSRLLTCDINGENLYNLLDDDMVSHCYWKNANEIIAYAKKKPFGNGYFLLKDMSGVVEHAFSFLKDDGHPSYNSKYDLYVTDTYPNKKRISTLRIFSDNKSFVLAQVFCPFKYDNEVRCDLHPRWSFDGKQIFFDATFEGNRALYLIKLKDNILNNNSISNARHGKHNIVYLMTSCKKCGPTQQTLNIIKHLDKKKYNPILITLYDEEPDSKINEYYDFITEHYFVKMNKREILGQKYGKILEVLGKVKPDIIHSVGVFPNYLVSKINLYPHIFTLRNYMYDDYPKKFGKFKGTILSRLQLKAVKNAVVVTCSESLQRMYQEKLKLKFKCIQNGVDLIKFYRLSDEERRDLRNNMGYKHTDFIYIFSGQFIERKNIPFLLEGFKKVANKDDKLILLGNGPEYDDLREKYSNKNIKFYGSVDEMNTYLNLGDVYVSTSKSEGLPNGVLEAMSVGLPVILSDIEQHQEILFDDNCGGYLFKRDDMQSFITALMQIKSCDIVDLGKQASKNVKENFSSEIMSKKYQKMYDKLLK